MNLFRLFRPDLRWIFYDCEIINCIPNRNEPQNPDLNYCGGWNDHSNMGISCIGTYSNWDNAYRIFDFSQLGEFQKLANNADHIIGFNSKSFDDKLCKANGLKIFTSYDLLSETWVAAGLPPTYAPGKTIPGYKLENLAQANFGYGKSGSGELAPMLWQQGKRQAVKGYCLGDVFLSIEILRLGWDGELIDPVRGGKLKLRSLA